MMYLSRETTNKNQSLKMQMMLPLDNEDLANNSQKIWSSNGFFGDQRGDFTIKKANFLESTLVYCNQGNNLNFESRRLCNLFGLCDIRTVNSCK